MLRSPKSRLKYNYYSLQQPDGRELKTVEEKGESVGSEPVSLTDLHVLCGICLVPGPFSLSCMCVREDKVCGDGEEVHRENRMICSVQGLCIDLIYFASLVIIRRVGVLFLRLVPCSRQLFRSQSKIFIERGN